MDILLETLSEQITFIQENTLLSIITLLGIVIGIGLILWLAWHQSTSPRPLRERTVVALLGAAFGLLMLNYLYPGDFVRGDGALHISRVWLMQDVLESGELPIWSNRFYFGYPHEIFYGFNTYLAIIGVSKLTGLDLFASTKLFLWIAHVASGIFMYLFARGRFAKAALAILVATAYVISWQHFGVVRRFGIMPLALIYALLPLFFLLIDSWHKKRISLPLAAVLGGILCALGVLTHIQYGAYLAATYVAAVVWIGVVSLVYRDWATVRQAALLSVGTGVIALLLAGWLAIPSVQESAYLPSIPQVFGTLSLEGLVTVVLNIALITNVFSSWGQGYIGLSILIPALIGSGMVAYRLLTRRSLNQEKLMWGYPFVIMAIGFFLLDPIKRYTGIWLFFVCIVAGYGVQWIARWLTQAAPKTIRLYQAAILLIVLELAPALLLVGGYRDLTPVHEDVKRLQGDIVASGIPGRIMVFQPDRGILWRAEDTMETGASIPFGSPLEAAPNTLNMMAAISNQLATEVYDSGGQPSERLLDLLRLMNVRYVLMNDEEFFEVTGATPVLFAPALEVAEAEDINGVMGHSVRDLYEDRQINTDYVNAVATQMQLDTEHPQAKAILIKQPMETMTTDSAACMGAQPFTFDDAVERHNSVTFNYSACGDGYIRLAYSYYPLMRLEVDGVETPFYADAFDMIVFPAPEGEYHVTLTAVPTPLREGLFRVAGISTIALIVWMGMQAVAWYRTRRSVRLRAELQQGY